MPAPPHAVHPDAHETDLFIVCAFADAVSRCDINRNHDWSLGAQKGRA